MQNVISHSDELINQEDTECNKQFSDGVIDYQNQVENIIAWLFSKEEELQQRPQESTLQDAAFSQVLDEYSRHEKFISEFCEYCQNIMKCKEDGQEMKENDILTEEDRDEIGIQMDAMMVCYEKLKILSTDRLRNLQRILEERQQTKIERFEEWLSAIEMKIASSNNIGPDFTAIQTQMRDMNDLRVELEQKQDFLNFMSSVIIFEELDSESLHLRSRSCESLDERLENMNRRWTDICRFVDERNDKLRKAESIWKLLNLEGPQLAAWLKKIERSLLEVSEAARNSSDLQSDRAFISKLLSRSDKIDLEIKSKQSFYTSLESRVRTEIEKFDDPCSMLVIELEKKLEDMQDNWNAIMNRKRMLDYTLQALSNPRSVERVTCNMIPVPDPITATSNQDLRMNNAITPDDYMSTTITTNHDAPKRELFNENLNNSSSSGNGERESSLRTNGTYSDPRVFDNSLSSDTRSLLYGNPNQDCIYNNDSQDELSSTSMTASFPINHNVPMIADDDGTRYSCALPSVRINLQQDIINHPTETSAKYHPGEDGAHSCRVEEWKHSLESFSTWLKQVETSLGIENALETIVGPDGNLHTQQSWSRLDIFSRLLLLDDIEKQIATTCQDEFDCLILQGQQIIEDLIPEIGENDDYETNLKDILADIEIRYSTVKRYLKERRQELADKDKWYRLLKILRESCDYLIEQMGQVIAETNIGVDLISLAQQQDQLMHAKADLDENVTIQSSIQEAKLFLKLCDTLQQQNGHVHVSLSRDNLRRHESAAAVKITNNDIWLSFKNLREDIEGQLDRLTLHFSELSQLIEDRLVRLDEVHREMHGLQHRMQELATRLQVAEILKSNWEPLDNLTVEKLSEQLEDLKLYRERLSEIESIHKMMNSIFEWMTQSDVPLSQQNLKRISELNTIWSLIQVSVEERQKLIEQAFDNQGASEQRFLNVTVAGIPRWERRVATSRVPYFIDHNNNKTKWDHPKFTDLLDSMSSAKQIIFAAYRTAMKLRMIQRKFGIDMLMLEQLKEIFELPILSSDQQQQVQADCTTDLPVQTVNNNDKLVGVEQIILYLKAIYERIQSEEKPTLDVPLSIDLTLNWLLNLYDSTRTGYISVMSLKVGLALICCATREEKYIYMYELVANQRTGSVNARKLGTLFETCMRVPVYLGEGDSFGGSEIIETSIRNCFSMSKFNPHNQNSIDMTDYLNWLKSEPQFISWLPVLHRLLISENTIHQVKCKLCRANPIVGLRYRCLKCFKYNICQNCFLAGRHLNEHYDYSEHRMQEYCSPTSSGENVRDLTKILRNKIKPKSSSRGSIPKQS